MDEVSKKCLSELFFSICWRALLSLALFFISGLSEDFSVIRHIAILVMVWIAAEALFIFLPNFIRHKKRWKMYEEYRTASYAAAQQSGGLKTIYSGLLDNYSTKSVNRE